MPSFLFLRRLSPNSVSFYQPCVVISIFTLYTRNKITRFKSSVILEHHTVIDNLIGYWGYFEIL